MPLLGRGGECELPLEQGGDCGQQEVSSSYTTPLTIQTTTSNKSFTGCDLIRFQHWEKESLI